MGNTGFNLESRISHLPPIYQICKMKKYCDTVLSQKVCLIF